MLVGAENVGMLVENGDPSKGYHYPMYGLPITNYEQCGTKITALLVVLVGYVCKTSRRGFLQA